MKKPEEIKKALKLCQNGSCNFCPYDDDEACGRSKNGDTLAYIQQLETRLAQVERERNAAVRAISDAQHYIKNLGAVQYGLQQLEKWDYCIKQRGVCEENTKGDADA